MHGDFAPLETTQKILRHAWLVVAFMLAGGLLGWGLARARPALYEARIVYAFSVDYTQTGILTDIEHDQAMDAAGDLLGSDAVLRAAVDRLAAEGVMLDVAALRGMSTRERTANDWVIRVRAGSPQQAAQIANAWGQAALEHLQIAYSHALRAQTILRYLESLESCLGRAVSSEPAQAFCSPDTLGEVLARFDAASAGLQSELAASQSVMPGLGYQWAEQAAVPAQRVSAGQGAGALAGAVLGWLAALIAVQADWLDGFDRRKMPRG